jgi:hypothetical protein
MYPTSSNFQQGVVGVVRSSSQQCYWLSLGHNLLLYILLECVILWGVAFAKVR